jgi:hypothetical protein
MFFSCEEIAVRPKRKVFARPKTDVAMSLEHSSNSPSANSGRRSSVRVNYSKYEDKIHSAKSHEAFAVLSNNKKGDPVLRQEIKASMPRAKIRKTPQKDILYDKTVAGGRPSRLLRGDADTAWRPSMKRVPYGVDYGPETAGKKSVDQPSDEIARDVPGSVGKKINKLSQLARGWDGRNAIIDNTHPQPKPLKLKKHFNMKYTDNLGADMMVSSETASIASPSPQSRRLSSNVEFFDNVSPANTRQRLFGV